MTSSWHSLTTAGALGALRSDTDGLAATEAARRLVQCGPNVFRIRAPVAWWLVLFNQMRSVLVLLLVAACVVAALTADAADAIAIAAVLVLNVAIGFVTELKAHRAMEAVLGLEVHRARVIRKGRSREVDARELVPGDVIQVEAGQTVPADARLLQSNELRAVESALSGEPGSVPKTASAVLAENTPVSDRCTMIYKTTSIVAGNGTAVVVGTGMATEVGRIGELTERVVKGRSPLERRLDSLGNRLAALSVCVAVLITLLGALQGAPLGELLQTAIALAVAAVPEGLPVVATIAMAVGIRRMAGRRALIRRLPVVETLGSVTVICTDKTGTLTGGQMTATVLRLADRELAVSGVGLELEGRFQVGEHAVAPDADQILADALRIGVLANAGDLHLKDGSWHPVGDPTDVAFLVLGRKGGIEREQLVKEWPEVQSLPFSSERMLMASFHRRHGKVVAFVKGAARTVIERCDSIATGAGVRPLGEGERGTLLEWNRELAARGLRVLALATGEVTRPEADALSGLTWVGFAGLSDPPAAGVLETVQAFASAGIRTVMITGDHRLTAASIARELGLSASTTDVLEGSDIERLSDAQLERIVPTVSTFGRVSPESKLRIVTAFQRRGEIVAMLGDGMNDAAALRKADVGVVMGGRGTDLAKEAADVVLEDDRFPTIGVAIEEGRVILENIRKFVIYLFSCNLAEILTLLGAGLAGYPTALAPLQLLWLNLLTDTLPALALAVEPGEPGIMRRHPPDPRMPILPAPLLRSAGVYAFLIALSTLAAFAWGLRRDPAVATTLAFMTLAFAQVFHLGNARSVSPVLSPSRALGNKYALGAVALAVTLQLVAALFPPLRHLLQVAPISGTEWLVIGALASLPAVTGQAFKSWRSLQAA
ncbi:MAG TPA: HAD-IC family P-type ATPase [Gemmatimonadales bacterium]